MAIKSMPQRSIRNHFPDSQPTPPTPFKQSRADSLTQALDDSLAARGYKSESPPIVSVQRGPKNVPMPKPESPKNLQKAKERTFIRKNPTTSI